MRLARTRGDEQEHSQRERKPLCVGHRASPFDWIAIYADGCPGTTGRQDGQRRAADRIELEVLSVAAVSARVSRVRDWCASIVQPRMTRYQWTTRSEEHTSELQSRQ